MDRRPVAAPPHASRLAADSRGGTIGEIVASLAVALGNGGVAAPRTEARDIVAALLDVPRFWPTLRGHELLAETVAAAAVASAGLRAAGAPLAYAVRRAAFRHLTLDIDERVLIPRPETEHLVELVLASTADSRGGTVIDVGTGSGAIALSLASEGRFARVIGTDISADAIAVARQNADRLAPALRASVEWRVGADLAPVRSERARVVVSNPPYVALGEAGELPLGVRNWEPPVALFAGADGMRILARVIRGAAGLLEPGGLVALEVDARRASLAADLVVADGRYRDIAVRLDLAGRERFVFARRAGPVREALPFTRNGANARG